MASDLLKRLEAAKEIAEPLRRRLWVVAVLAEALRPAGIRPVVVGGSAVEFYTLGGYATADVDLVVGDRARLGEVLETFGFRGVGRFWHRDDLELVIECPDEVLAGDPDRVLEVEIEDLVCPVIGLEDLIVDRLNGYVHWKWEDDGRWVRELIVSNRKHLDLSYLRRRTQAEGTAEELEAMWNDETG
ncbi:MAG: UbiD family decarboxylase [bacterium]|nr:UbiD family decarboxylase [bacterium]